jgi:hypothetical protein
MLIADLLDELLFVILLYAKFRADIMFFEMVKSVPIVYG